MKHLLLTTIAAVVLVGCGSKPGIWKAAKSGNIEVVKQHLTVGVDVNVKDKLGCYRQRRRCKCEEYRQRNTARLGHQAQTSRNRRPPPQTRWQDPGSRSCAAYCCKNWKRSNRQKTLGCWCGCECEDVEKDSFASCGS